MEKRLQYIAGIMLVVFAYFCCGNTFFIHSHTCADGNRIVHSHPYCPLGNHNHGSNILSLIALYNAAVGAMQRNAETRIPASPTTFIVIDLDMMTTAGAGVHYFTSGLDPPLEMFK